MRKIVWPVVGLVGLAVVAGGLLLYRATSAPPQGAAPVSTTVPLRATTSDLAVAPETPTSSQPAISQPAISQPATSQSVASQPAAPPPDAATPAASSAETPAAPTTAAAGVTEAPAPVPPAPPAAPGSDLPVVAVAPRVTHVVPEHEPAPAPAVTVIDRNGRVMNHILPRPDPPERVAAALPPPRPAVPAPAPLNGAAQAGSATVITVSGQPVKLFGVRPADASDVCLAANGRARPCSDAAREALAARLASFSGVHCRTPPGQRGDGGSICLDGAGVDLAGFLVGEGLALANPRESSDYVGAEGVARANKRGLWHYR